METGLVAHLMLENSTGTSKISEETMESVEKFLLFETSQEKKSDFWQIMDVFNAHFILSKIT